MKRAYIAAALLILLLTGGTIISRYLVASTAELAEQVSDFEMTTKTGENREASARKLDELIKNWEAKRPYLIAIAGRMNCEPIEAAIVTIPVWFEKENEAELMATLSQLSSHISELGELHSPGLINLF